MEYIQLLFTNISETEKEIIIALLGNIEFEGFEEDENTLKALIPQEKFDEDLFNSIIQLNQFNYSKSIIKEQNWNEKWESDFEPVMVNHPITLKPFAYIRAGFHKPNNEFEYDVEITPKMSFGTGHHNTTYLMVAHMSGINFTNKSVIDFGTVTGVLAILAEKLGAAKVIGIDNDEWSINNAQENILVNSCSNITLLNAETIDNGLIGEIVLANINLNIIAANIDQIRNAAVPETIFLFSGIMLHDEENILRILKNGKINVSAIFKMGEWICIKATL